MNNINVIKRLTKLLLIEYEISLAEIETIINFIKDNYIKIDFLKDIENIYIRCDNKVIYGLLQNIITELKLELVKDFVYFSGCDYSDKNIQNILFDIIAKYIE